MQYEMAGGSMVGWHLNRPKPIPWESAMSAGSCHCQWTPEHLVLLTSASIYPLGRPGGALRFRPPQTGAFHTRAYARVGILDIDASGPRLSIGKASDVVAIILRSWAFKMEIAKPKSADGHILAQEDWLCLDGRGGCTIRGCGSPSTRILYMLERCRT